MIKFLVFFVLIMELNLLLFVDSLSIISHSIGSKYSCYINSNYKMKCFGTNGNKKEYRVI